MTVKNAVKKRVEMTRPPAIGVGTLNLSSRAKELVLAALDNNRLSYGALSQEFESKFSRFHGCRFGVLSNSGTSALQVALQAMKELHGWEDGDEVIIPAVTFVATANIVLHNRMTPVPVDVEKTYYELDPVLIESKISPKTRAIIPVHLFGHPADMDPIREIAKRRRLKIIEDSCETMFASYQGQSVGSLGDIGCFSTYVAHLLVTGTGGLNTTNNPEYAVRIRSLVNHGRDSIYLNIDDDNQVSAEELRMIIARRFQFVSVGHNFRLTEMEAALGLAQLEEWESIIAARRANAKVLIAKLRPLEAHLQLPDTRPGSDHSFMMFPIVLRDEPKEELVNFIEQRGVETRDMLPLTNQPVYHRLLGWHEADYPAAKHINENGFYIGCHQDITETDIDYISELFERYFQKSKPSKKTSACLIIELSGNDMLEAIEQVPREFFSRVIVMDRSGSEKTRAVLEGLDVEILNGRKDPLEAVASGEIAVAEESVVFFPANGRHDVADIAKLAIALERGYDMAVASRFFLGGGRRSRYRGPAYRSIGNRVFTLLANLLFYGNLTDSLSGFRAVKREKLAKIPPRGTGLAALYNLSLEALRQKWKVAEIPTVETMTDSAMKQGGFLVGAARLAWVWLKAWRE